MTSGGSAARNGHEHRPAAVDLSVVFGAAAAALARPRIRRQRPRESREPAVVEPEIVEDDVHAPRQRFGAVEVRDRRHVDLLLLAAATTGPASARELVDRVRERSDGLFVLSLRVVIRELHRLANNRLLQVSNERVHRYAVAPLGERVLATRRREWEAFSHGLDGVLDAAERSL